MYYKTLQEYLNDQIRLPLIKAIKDGDVSRALSIIDFFCFKFNELNAFSNGRKEFEKDNGFDKDEGNILEYLSKYIEKHLQMKEWTEVDAHFSESIKDECDKFYLENKEEEYDDEEENY